MRASAFAVAAPVLALALFGGVIVSDAMQYHTSNLAPTARYQELESIDHRFAGRGPTLFTDFDEYSLYALRDLDVGGPNFIYSPPALSGAGGRLPLSGRTRSPAAGGLPLPLIVTRRDPTRRAPAVGLQPAVAGHLLPGVGPPTRRPGGDRRCRALRLTGRAVRPHRAPRGARPPRRRDSWSRPARRRSCASTCTEPPAPPLGPRARRPAAEHARPAVGGIRSASRRRLGCVAPGPDHAHGHGQRGRTSGSLRSGRSSAATRSC